MERQFDSELKLLKDKILHTGEKVEMALHYAVKGLTERKKEYFSQVFEIEKEINQAHIDIDDACVKLLARQSPLAGNLRLIVAVIKINSDLERMGDQAVAISHRGKDYIAQDPLKPLVDIPKMAQEVREMVNESLASFVREDTELAKKVLSRDDLVDDLRNEVFNELTAYMEKDSTSVKRAIGLILIARNLERIADHATNIAEDVIFVITGKDIRHGAGRT